MSTYTRGGIDEHMYVIDDMATWLAISPFDVLFRRLSPPDAGTVSQRFIVRGGEGGVASRSSGIQPSETNDERTQVKLDCALSMDALQEVPEVARAAEETGFAGMWANDTKHNPFVTLALAAPSTSRLELGTGVAVAFARSPMVTAQTAWDLARLSGGRFLLGLGTQVKAHIERRFGFAWDPPVPKLREYVQVLRAVWRSWQEGMPLRVEGEYYRISLMAPFFDPGPNPRPRIPIFVAGVGRLLCQLAGEVGDGFVVHPLHSVPYIREVVLPNIAAGLAKSGRARGDVQLYAPVFLALGETPAEVDAAASRTDGRLSRRPGARRACGMGGLGDHTGRVSRAALPATRSSSERPICFRIVAWRSL